MRRLRVFWGGGRGGARWGSCPCVVPLARDHPRPLITSSTHLHGPLAPPRSPVGRFICTATTSTFSFSSFHSSFSSFLPCSWSFTFLVASCLLFLFPYIFLILLSFVLSYLFSFVCFLRACSFILLASAFLHFLLSLHTFYLAPPSPLLSIQGCH